MGIFRKKKPLETPGEKATTIVSLVKIVHTIHNILYEFSVQYPVSFATKDTVTVHLCQQKSRWFWCGRTDSNGFTSRAIKRQLAMPKDIISFWFISLVIPLLCHWFCLYLWICLQFSFCLFSITISVSALHTSLVFVSISFVSLSTVPVSVTISQSIYACFCH